MAKGPHKNRTLNFAISLVVALGALVYFSQRSGGNSQPEPAQKIQPLASTTSPGKSSAPPPVGTGPVSQSATAGKVPAGAPQGTAPNQILPPGFPADRVTVTEGAAPVTLPPDLQAQIDSAHNELPEDLKRQLNAPPPELPADLKAQLNAPPAELPEDIKRALNTPPRVVTIDEVNNPNPKSEPGK